MPNRSIPAVPNRKLSLQCSAIKYPCIAQPPSLPAAPLHCPTTKSPCSAQPHGIPVMPDRRVSLHCPTAKYPCSAQPLSILALTAKYPCSAQLQSIPAASNHQIYCRAHPKSMPAVPKGRVSLECPTAEYQYSCSALAVLQGRQLRGGRETLQSLCNNGFRVGMLEVNNSI